MSWSILDPRRAAGLIIAIGFGWLAASMGEHAIAEEKRIDGSAAYRERIALDPQAELLVKLQDVSPQDVAASTIAAMRFATGGRVPIRFSLPYQAELIRPAHSYSVSAELVLDRKVIFRTTQVYPVLTGGAGESVDLLLVRSQENSDEAAPSPAGSWLAEDIGGGGVIDNLQSTLTIEADGRAYGMAGCNNFTGAAEFDANSLSFGPMAMTMKACIDAIADQERKFMDAIGNTKSYRRDDNFLFLLADDGRTLARLVRHQG